MEKLPFNLSSNPTPVSPDDHPKTKLNKNIQRNKNAITTKHANNCPSYLILKDHLFQVIMFLHLGFKYIIILDSGVPPKVQQYMITNGSFPKCSCHFFKDMATKA
jgi:hypothetical protein